jgi:geranylgeranyl pyrophosphate synthase
MGKPVGSDLHQGIITLPTLYYVETHPEDPLAKMLMAGECLSEGQVNRLIDSIRKSDAIRRSHQEAVDYVERGLESLCSLPASPERFALEELANYIVERKF